MSRNGRPTVMRTLRERQGWTQARLAQELGCRQPAVSIWESLEGAMPDARRAACARLLAVDPAWLLRAWDEYARRVGAE